uniref:Glycosyltransferase 2-like domain-containing protein n=1 Tax=Callorhinchus milii TaxID=7868 RepID=A0A4W3HUH9_CALMI
MFNKHEHKKPVLSGKANITDKFTDIEVGEKEMNGSTGIKRISSSLQDTAVKVALKVHQTKDPQTNSTVKRGAADALEPRPGMHPVGQFGRAAKVPKEQEQVAKAKWAEGHFNVHLSELIPLDRALPDTRPAGCANQLVHSQLPTTSIIMCFVDEVWSTLLRSVHSILNRSPSHLITEIILVDDFSTKGKNERVPTPSHVFPKVRIIHLKTRHGLIQARLAGADVATGDVLTFLDSHVECNVGWLEPLLERIHLKRTTVSCPVIEVISDEDMSYMGVYNFLRGIFTWPMNFGWKQIPSEILQISFRLTLKFSFRCPVMAGGLFSIDKKYFYELGAYDPGLEVWGGENMELSFKVWMCGGEIEIIPCSRVGHIFRDGNPYTFPKDRIKTVERNLARVAEVWLDEYIDGFFTPGNTILEKKLSRRELSI